MQRVLAILFLEAYALVLAFLRFAGGVRGDEAGLLLNVPNPYPPLVRTILHRTEFLSWDDLLWRVILATVLVQAVWIIFEVAHGLPKKLRLILCGAWVFSASMVLTAGTISVEQITAVEALLLVLLLTMEQDLRTGGILSRFKRYLKAEKDPSPLMRFLHDLLHHRDERFAFVIAMLWAVSLFTAYQTILFAPIVIVLLWRSVIKPWKKYLYFFAPLLLLATYTLRNPLIAAYIFHIVTVSEEQISFLERLYYSVSLWSIGGGFAVSLLGTYGMIKTRRWELLVSLAFVFLFVFSAPSPQNAILFLPLFIGGTYFLFHTKKFSLHPGVVIVGAGLMCITALIIFPHGRENAARDMLKAIPMDDTTATILLVGQSGYEWAYYSTLPVLRYSEHLQNPITKYMVCTKKCPELLKSGMTKVPGAVGEVYER